MDDGASNVPILLVHGSLQRQSSNSSLLEVAAAHLGPTAVHFADLEQIPLLNPDRFEDDLPAVATWRQAIAASEVVLLAAPEYAGGLSGAVKNALDWIVGSGEFYRKPVGLVSAGTSGGAHARHNLAQTLIWQGAYVVAELGVASPKTKTDANGVITDETTIAEVQQLANQLRVAARLPIEELVVKTNELAARFGIEPGHVPPP